MLFLEKHKNPNLKNQIPFFFFCLYFLFFCSPPSPSWLFPLLVFGVFFFLLFLHADGRGYAHSVKYVYLHAAKNNETHIGHEGHSSSPLT